MHQRQIGSLKDSKDIIDEIKEQLRLGVLKGNKLQHALEELRIQLDSVHQNLNLNGHFLAVKF